MDEKTLDEVRLQQEFAEDLSENEESSEPIPAPQLENDETTGISEEELDYIADTAISVIQGILKYFRIGEITIDEYEGDEGELILDISGDDLAVIIGRHGKTLDALQYMVTNITNAKIGYRYHIIIDVEGYKARQRKKLENLARTSAYRAVSQNRSISLRPMSPYERRIIHIALRDDRRVTTMSEGEGATRHIVVIPQ